MFKGKGPVQIVPNPATNGMFSHTRPQIKSPLEFDAAEIHDFAHSLAKNKLTKFTHQRLWKELRTNPAFVARWSNQHAHYLAKFAKQLNYQIKDPEHAATELLGEYLVRQTNSEHLSSDEQFKLLEKAAALNHPDAIKVLGNSYYIEAQQDIGNLEHAIDLLTIAARDYQHKEAAELLVDYLLASGRNYEVSKYAKAIAANLGIQGTLFLANTYNKLANLAQYPNIRKQFLHEFMFYTYQAQLQIQHAKQQGLTLKGLPTLTAMQQTIAYHERELQQEGFTFETLDDLFFEAKQALLQPQHPFSAKPSG